MEEVAEKGHIAYSYRDMASFVDMGTQEEKVTASNTRVAQR